MEDPGCGCISPLSSGSLQSSPEEDDIVDLEGQDPRVGLTGQTHPSHPTQFPTLLYST